MAGKLKIHVFLSALLHQAGPVGQHDARGVSGRAFQGPPHVRAGEAEGRGGLVGDARQHQLLAPSFQNHMGILQGPDALLAAFRHPALVAPVIFMIARTGKHAQRRTQVRQRCEITASPGGRAVGQIAGDHDQIRLERVGFVHHGLDPVPWKSGTNVRIRKLDDTKAVQGLRQPGQGQAELVDVRHAQCLPDGHGAQKQGKRQQSRGPFRRLYRPEQKTFPQVDE